MQGRFAEAREILDEIVARYRKTPYRTTTKFRLLGVFVTFFNGALREEVRRGKLLLRHVEDRGDVYTAVCLRTTVMVDSALADDDPEEARRNLRVAMDRWTTDGFNVKHWYVMASEAAVELYVGDGARAYARIERDAVALKKSFLLHSRLVRGYTAYVRGCCAVASAGADPTLAPARIREARRMGRRLEREGSLRGVVVADDLPRSTRRRERASWPPSERRQFSTGYPPRSRTSCSQMTPDAGNPDSGGCLAAGGECVIGNVICAAPGPQSCGGVAPAGLCCCLSNVADCGQPDEPRVTSESAPACRRNGTPRQPGIRMIATCAARHQMTMSPRRQPP